MGPVNEWLRIEYVDSEGLLQWSEPISNPHDVAVEIQFLLMSGASINTVFRERPRPFTATMPVC